MVGKQIRAKLDWHGWWCDAQILLCLSFFAGGLIGGFLSALSGGEGATELMAYLCDYLTVVTQNKVYSGVWPIVWSHTKDLLLILLFGYTALGVVGLPILFGIKGFFFAFSVGCFCRVYGAEGLAPGFALFGVSALLWVPALFLLGVLSFSNAKILMGRVVCTSGKWGVPVEKDCWTTIWLSMGLISGCVLLECWVIPVLLQTAAHIVL